MDYSFHYTTPMGGILLASNGTALTGLWFDGQKHYASTVSKDCTECDLPIFREVIHWLDLYFQGAEPNFLPAIHLIGSPFQQQVWGILRTIPYGRTMTYGAIARQLSIRSAQAVGNAVGRNPVSILIPCHRVVGSNGRLTGYAGGLDKKEFLLTLERKTGVTSPSLIC